MKDFTKSFMSYWVTDKWHKSEKPILVYTYFSLKNNKQGQQNSLFIFSLPVSQGISLILPISEKC